MNDEEARDYVLQYLLEQQRKYPMRHIGYPKAQIVSNMWEDDSSRRAAVAMAVDFLEDEGYLKTQTQQHTKYYRLSSKAQARVLGPSVYSKGTAQTAGAHVTNNGGIVFLGDNYGTVGINMRSEVSEALYAFTEAVNSARGLTDSIKADLIHNASTIDAQVKTQNPDQTIVSRAWNAIQFSAQVGTTLTSIGQDIAKLEPHISRLLQQIH